MEALLALVMTTVYPALVPLFAGAALALGLGHPAAQPVHCRFIPRRYVPLVIHQPRSHRVAGLMPTE